MYQHGIGPHSTQHITPSKSMPERVKDLETELEKVKFHLRKMSEEIDSKSCPLACLSITMDWSEGDLKNVIDMFYRYREALHNGEKIDLEVLRNSLMNLTNSNYDEVKDIIVALYRSQRFEVVEVCEKFAEANSCAEFNEILHR